MREICVDYSCNPGVQTAKMSFSIRNSSLFGTFLNLLPELGVKKRFNNCIDKGGSMFGHFLLDQGVEVELPVGMREVIDFLDGEVSGFTCGEYGYNFTSSKATMDTQWELQVKPQVLETSIVVEPAIGSLVVQKLDESITSFKIPPRPQWEIDGEPLSDKAGKLFSSFIFQMLNAFQSRGYIQLPGVLPVE